MIDHLVYASNDLRRASTAIDDLLGVVPSPGGSHVGRGTYNALVSLGGATYLEVIGPDPGQPATDVPRSFGIDDLVEPALVAWCARPQRPLADVIAEARAAGIDFGGLATMSRRRLDGVLLEWQHTLPQLEGPFGHVLPFLIDWGDSAHPTETLTPVVRLVELELIHPQAQLVRAALEIVGITAGVTVRAGEQSALRAIIATDHGNVTL